MSWEEPGEYKGCALCEIQGPFEPELFRHYLLAHTEEMSLQEAIPQLMGWVAGNGFVPEYICFFKDTESHVNAQGKTEFLTTYAVRFVTRFVSYHSGWYNHMKNPERVPWDDPRDRPIVKTHLDGVGYTLTS